MTNTREGEGSIHDARFCTSQDKRIIPGVISMTSQNKRSIPDVTFNASQGKQTIHDVTSNTSHDKWIVLDVTSGSCPDVIHAPPGWKILLVGETTQTKGDNSKVAIPGAADSDMRLDRERERGERGSFMGQKGEEDREEVWERNEVYLQAIAQGAKQILETDCSVSMNASLQLLIPFPSRHHQGLLYNSTLLFNPYAHFGAWALTPRALHLSSVSRNSQLYYLRDFHHNVLVKHLVTDNSSDALDTRAKSAGDAGVRFDPSSPPVFLGHGSFSPVVPACSLYVRDTFWALPFPCVSSGLYCRVLRVLVQQRLLRELDAFSAFYPLASASPTSVSGGGKSSYFTGDTFAFTMATVLDAWKCPEDFSFYDCFIHLADHLHRKGFIVQAQSKMMASFTFGLRRQSIGEPMRVKTSWRGLRTVTELKVKLGSVRTLLETKGTAMMKILNRTLQGPVKARCAHSAVDGQFPSVRQWLTPAVEDVVLIVVFNKQKYFWENFPFLETVYRPYFKHMVYCLSDIDLLLRTDHRGLLNHVTLLEALSDYWYMMYACTMATVQMNLKGVQGYLQIGDDTLINPWNFFNASRDVLYIHNFGRVLLAKSFFVRPYWMWWPSSMGRCPLLKVMSELEEISGLSKRQLLELGGISPNVHPKRRVNTFSEILHRDKRGCQKPETSRPVRPDTEVWPKPSQEQARRFLYNYYHVHNMAGKVVGKTQDFIYIPQVMADDYMPLSRLFLKHRVMVEVGMHAIQLALAARREDLHAIQANSLWHQDRNIPDIYFNESHFYLHPLKVKYTFRERLRTFYCDFYLTTLFSKLKRTH